MADRDDILSRLRAHERSATPPPAWRSRRHFEDLVERFATSLTAADGEVVQCADLTEALARLGAVLEELGARRVAVNAEPPLNALNLPERWPGIDWHITGMTPGDLRAFCISADVGLTGADAALAETGTVVIGSGPGRSRLVPLLPPVHIALVSTACLTTDLFTWTASRAGPPAASLTLISGPSKTADIEQTLAIGVHGPRRFIAILYGDR
jgi:L-lactate dehydrogenase complex protein LldG